MRRCPPCEHIPGNDVNCVAFRGESLMNATCFPTCTICRVSDGLGRLGRHGFGLHYQAQCSAASEAVLVFVSVQCTPAD